MDSTIAKGLAALDWLVRQQRPCRVSELAEALQIGRSNAHRTLQTLVECGWVVQETASSAYRPSVRLIELGAMVEGTADLRSRLKPLLKMLADVTGETIHLAELDGAEIVYLEKFDSPLPVAAYSRVGGRAPAYCVASGKALLAALAEDADALRARLGRLAAHTPNSIVDFARLQSELARTHDRGWAENREEWRLGVCGLGAAVLNARGDPVAAIGISLPSIRFVRPRVKLMAQEVVACAAKASAAIGYRGHREALEPSTQSSNAR